MNLSPYTPFVEIQNHRVITTSQAIADYFHKQHKNILRAIENLECSHDFRQLNFEQSYYFNEQNRKMPMVNMTKNGFMFLVMGFTGRLAAQLKEQYIDAFDRMSKQLDEQQSWNVASFYEPLIDELLKSNHAWRRIIDYKQKGLTNKEISKLLGCHYATLSGHLRRMEACGLLKAPANLAQMQHQAFRLKAAANG